MIQNPKAFLQDVFAKTIAHAHPNGKIADYLPEDRTGRAIVIGAGKAAAAMAQEFERHWLGPLTGLVVTRYGHGEPCQHIRVVQAAHPVPDDAGFAVAQEMLELVSNLTEQDRVYCLMSGGASALLSLPGLGISHEEKQHINKALLKSGASIAEMNCVRKHLSRIKGGRLLEACYPAKVVTLAISDVPGDDPSVIGSGPTVADPTSREDALEILQRYAITIPNSVQRWLDSPESETLKPSSDLLRRSEFHLIASPGQTLQATIENLEKSGLNVLSLGDCIEGEAKEVAKVHGGIVRHILARQQPVATPCVIISGGETTVTVKGQGRGGRNAEFLLSLFQYLTPNTEQQQQEVKRIFALAADTDGIDGSEDNAGCWFDGETYVRANELGLDANAMLANNDGYGFFQATQNLIITGPTRTNVNDLRVILIV